MKYNVLVVDDDKLVNDFLVETMERAGYKTDAVYSGEDALLTFREKEYDIVLADYKMKEMDGVTLLKHIKAINPDTVYIIMTAFGTVEISFIEPDKSSLVLLYAASTLSRVSMPFTKEPFNVRERGVRVVINSRCGALKSVKANFRLAGA